MPNKEVKVKTAKDMQKTWLKQKQLLEIIL